MNNQRQFNARFFDGKTAIAHDVIVVIGQSELSIATTDEDNIQQFIWSYHEMMLLEKRSNEVRFGHKHFDDAILVLTIMASEVISDYAPDLLSGRKERKKYSKTIIGLVAASAILTGGIFWGVPALSGPLAKATPKPYEIKMGENFATQINTFIKPCKGADKAIALMSPAINAMAEKGDVGFSIKFQFVKMTPPNAFALPGGQVMATKGLLLAVGDDQEAFMAVIAHELGHVKSRDGMRAFYRNAGLGILLEVITGGSGLAQQSLQIAGQLNQVKHTRRQEALADDIAIELMTKSSYNPEALARAFEYISPTINVSIDGEEIEASAQSSNNKYRIPEWLSSHPDTNKRIQKARAYNKPSTRKIFTDEEWSTIKSACSL